MNEHLDKMLCKRYPILYSERNESPIRSAMKYGFSCNDGWFNIIDKLSMQLEELNHTLEEKDWIIATQVKEKFGLLAFYYKNGISLQKEIDKLISAATNESSRTCEECGQPAECSKVNNWYNTLCLKHLQEREKNAKNKSGR